MRTLLTSSYQLRLKVVLRHLSLSPYNNVNYYEYTMSIHSGFWEMTQ